MSDGAFPDRLAQLRARWESDPSSRIFLQLAEEYRHQGRVREALLVRAYIETSEPEKARERLDLYTLLNDSDPEIEELRRRLRAMDQPPQAENPRPPAAPPPPPAPSRTAGNDLFDLGRPAAPPRPAGGDVFELDLPAPRAVAPAVGEAEPFAELC